MSLLCDFEHCANLIASLTLYNFPPLWYALIPLRHIVCLRSHKSTGCCCLFQLWNLRVDAWIAVLQINSRSGCPHQCVICSGRSSMMWDFNNISMFLVRGLPTIVHAIANGIILRFGGLHALYIEGACNFSNFSLGDGTTTLKTVSVIIFIFKCPGPRHSSHN
jgi:hypothetical protein